MSHKCVVTEKIGITRDSVPKMRCSHKSDIQMRRVVGAGLISSFNQNAAQSESSWGNPKGNSRGNIDEL